MKGALCIFAVIMVLFIATAAGADTVRYVKENFKISVRGSASEKADAIGALTAGDQVSVTRTSGNWSFVKAGKVEGWVATSLLVDDAPAVTRFNAVKAENDRLKKENDANSAELVQLRTENTNLKQILDNSNPQLKAYVALMGKTNEELVELVDIKENYKNLEKELAIKSQRLELLESAASKTLFFNYLRWFFSGAAVLVVGFLIGMLAKRGNRRYY